MRDAMTSKRPGAPASAMVQKPSEDSPIADAVAASVEGLRTTGDVESALMDASYLGQLAYHAFCNLGFDEAEPPTLSKDESSIVYWTICQLSYRIDEAKDAFYENLQAQRVEREAAREKAAS